MYICDEGNAESCANRCKPATGPDHFMTAASMANAALGKGIEVIFGTWRFDWRE